ncbi:hypothetical protein [Acinetobacter faecalis]|uniref:hypothetical protein n=1 Tax=Acinetobacter faecalis TaxID=2665161 RepID=UPI002A91EFBA|nr:hypothetical protein [Acinetobacter faecalis]MDY6455938.1 hypothetical protein [Acinetobacter faecalis]
MSKMIDLFEQNLVQNFSQFFFSKADSIENELHQNIQNTSENDLKSMIANFFAQPQAQETAIALDLQQNEIQALLAGEALTQTHLESTAKIVAYYLAMETDAFSKVEVFDSLKDYPM